MEGGSPDGQAPRPPRKLWLWVAAVATLDATQSVFSMRAVGMQHSWTAVYFVLLLSWLPWVFAAPLVVRWGRTYPLDSWHPLSKWCRHAVAWLTISIATGAWIAGLEEFLNPWANPISPEPFWPLWLEALSNTLLQSLLVYSVILGVDFALRSRQLMAQQLLGAARLSEQLSRSQLDALRHQIEPHFLFNALNGVAALIREQKNDTAVDMLVGLSDILRRLVAGGGSQEVTLGDELQLVRRYLAIQKMRFPDRLDWEVDAPQDLHAAKIPSLILQPLVENAFKHGITTRARAGQLRIMASRTDSILSVVVYNDGPKFADDWRNRTSGIGLRNVQDRLRHLYGSDFGLTTMNLPFGVEVTIHLPYRTG